MAEQWEHVDESKGTTLSKGPLKTLNSFPQRWQRSTVLYVSTTMKLTPDAGRRKISQNEICQRDFSMGVTGKSHEGKAKNPALSSRMASAGLPKR